MSCRTWVALAMIGCAVFVPRTLAQCPSPLPTGCSDLKFFDDRQVIITNISPRDSVADLDTVTVDYDVKCHNCNGGPQYPFLVQAFVDGSTFEAGRDGGTAGNPLNFFIEFPAMGGSCKHTVQLKATWDCTAGGCQFAHSKTARFYMTTSGASSYKTCETVRPDKCGEGITGDPVDVAVGRVFSTHVDLEVPGPYPVTFERFHDSSRIQAADNGVLG